MKLVFATNNVHKLEEVKSLLDGSFEILTLQDIGCLEEIEETALTIEGNAQIKTDYIKDHYGFDCFADDTGLEVVALNGEPGVYSARYAGKNASSHENVDKLLDAMSGLDNRKAQFRTVISLFIQDKQYFFEGVCEGEILQMRKGNKGFGYDPIFQPKGYDVSFAQMDMQRKGMISHRGLAVQKLIKFLKTFT